jgi:GT2 family glycosyltransferase
MKLSIIVLCWNDLPVISDCLRSIYANTHATDFEVIVSDNGSSDGSIDFIRRTFPGVRLIENGTNLRFAKANNVGIQAARGDYVLILNPDTVIHDGTLDKIVEFADQHPEAGAFACRVLNADGSYQISGRPAVSLRSGWVTALYLRPLGYLSDWFNSDMYVAWKGDTQRQVGWVSGCFILVRADLVKRLGGFDEQFFYYYEDTDLCRRIWESGSQIIFTPEMTITHLGGQSTKKKFPALNFVLDAEVTRYLYYYKYYGAPGARQARVMALTGLFLRRLGYRLAQLVRSTSAGAQRLELLQALYEWTRRVDPVRLVENKEEPDLGTRTAGRVLER